MPTNVTPQYEKAEQAYRQASGDDEKLAALREMLRTVPKHKGSEKLQADIKRRISRLNKSMKSKSAAAKGPDPFHVPKSGAGQVVLLGEPNVGKSAIVAATTSASVKVAEYPYTTQIPAPGMWAHEDVQIELVDTPPVTSEHVPPGLTGTLRHSDVIAIVVDLAGAALEQTDTALAVLAERRIVLRSVPCSEIDAVGPAGDTDPHAGLIVANKVDRVSDADVETYRELYGETLEIFPVSAETGAGLGALNQRLWELLSVVRVYTKQPGRDADMSKPFILPSGATVDDLAADIHRELPERMKFARVWGEGRFDGQQVQRSEPLGDGDIVEIHE